MNTLLRPSTPTGHFVRHFLEMVVAMIVGMIALGPLWTLALEAIGRPDILHATEPSALIMATNMSVAMCAWMRFRGHGWPATLEMAAAMYLPFVLLFPPLWAGLIPASAVMLGGHALMLPAMLGAMVLRRAEYSGHHLAKRP